MLSCRSLTCRLTQSVESGSFSDVIEVLCERAAVDKDEAKPNIRTAITIIRGAIPTSQ
jgi:hypothetical protein